MVTGGEDPSAQGTTYVEQFNGTAWTEVADINLGIYAACLFGTTSAAVKVGGYTGGNETEVEQWDGTSWTETTDIPRAHYAAGQAGTATAGLISGGIPYDASTFEWTGPAAAAVTFTSS